MDNRVERFLKCIGYPEEFWNQFDESFMTGCRTTNAKTDFFCELHLKKFMTYKACKEFFSILEAFEKINGGFHTQADLIYQKNPDENEIRTFIDDYIEERNYPDLSNYRINMADSTITFEYSAVMDSGELKKETMLLASLLKKASAPFLLQLGLVSDMNEDSDDRAEQKMLEGMARQQEVDKVEELEYQRQKKLDMTYIPCKIKDADSGSMKRVEVTGTIFSSELKDIKNKTKQMVTIYYTDDSYSMASSIFEGKKFDREFLATLKVGTRIKIKGEPMYDDYSKQMTIRVNDLSLLPPLPERKDEYKGDKRIELHLHSTMSTMDGVSEAKEYCATAGKWGWSAIGITDHGGCAAFPSFQDEGKKNNLKVLYGSELYMVDDKLRISFNPVEKPLKDMEYVVFDLETSGLSCRYDRIIEFGAVKIHQGNVVDNCDFFIKPDRKLSKVTTDLTGITDEMVEGGLSINKALDQISEFIGNATLVAHNGQFDYGFLNEAMKNNGRARIPNPVIDTLPLSRYMYPDMKSHSLGALSRKLGIVYDEEEAHRAIYDAEVLNNVWEVMKTNLINPNPTVTHASLNKLTSDAVINNAPHPYHICVYAKNKDGLKDLFKIVSEGYIKHINGVPRIPRSTLESYHANLLFGSACFNGEVFESAMTKGEEYTEEVMKFYDYIEIQPPCEYDFLVHDGQLSSMDDVYKILKDIIKMAKDIHKPVVATSDAHYVDPKEKIYRDVFVFAPGIKGVRHPLNPYRRDKMPYYANPDQHLRTTDEMLKDFSFLGDENLIREIVIDNTHLIADQIDPSVRPIHDYLSAPIIDNCDKLLSDKVYRRAHEWYGDPLPELIQKRLDAEMHGISEHHFEVIYWIASKIVTQTKDAGYIVGSRGSVGSSFVATMADITEVNPLPPHYRCPKCKHVEFIADPNVKTGYDAPNKKCPVCGAEMIADGDNIPFATFIGFKGDKTPDIDLNFPRDFQSKAHEMTKHLLTEESGNHVYKAGTTESVQDNIAIGYAKGYFENLEKHPELGVKAEEISKAELLRVAKGCVGVKRTTGQHPGGIIVIPRGMDVYDFTPIQYPADKADAEWETSHFDYNQMHDTILKLDLLGHVDPMTLRMMSEMTGVDLYGIPFNDPDVMSLFTSTKALHLKRNTLNAKVGTTAMPEFGTNYVQNLILETKPKSFADLLRVQGLAHGTNVYAGNQQDLIRNGTMTIDNCIGCRDDIMIQLHDNWGMDLEEAFKIMEITRHGRFKHPKPKEGKRETYVNDMKEHNVPQYYIDTCDKIQYLFPKAHAAAYTMMALRVGWFKVHKPLAFYATYFTCRCDQFDLKVMCSGEQAVLNKLKEIDDLRQMRKLKPTESDLELVLQVAAELYDRGFSIEKINVEKSDAVNFTFDEDKGTVIPSFKALAGVGDNAALTVIEARKQGRFTSIEDFSSRTKITTQKIQELKDLGAFGDLPDSDQMTLF